MGLRPLLSEVLDLSDELVAAVRSVPKTVCVPRIESRHIHVADKRPKASDLSDRRLQHEIEVISRLEAFDAPWSRRPKIDNPANGAITHPFEPSEVSWRYREH